MTYKIAFANEKGGVAKTTSVLSISAALVELGHTVLMVDMDAQANLTLAMGIEPGKVSPSIAQILLSSAEPIKVQMETGIPNLFILPSNNEISMAERLLPTHAGYEMTLSRALEGMIFDYIIIDCPPHLGALTLNALNAADLLIMPTQAEYFSVYALRNMMNLIRRIRVQFNQQLKYRLLLTMFSRRNRIHRTLFDQLHATFGSGMLETVIEMDTKLRESQIAGLPIIYHAPKSRSALQYRALTQEVLAYVQETTEQPA